MDFTLLLLCVEAVVCDQVTFNKLSLSIHLFLNCLQLFFHGAERSRGNKQVVRGQVSVKSILFGK